MSKESAPRQILVAEMAPHVHSFLSGENKVNKISTWLIEWIKNNQSLYDASKIEEYSLGYEYDWLIEKRFRDKG